jgi:CheY-like chemotaxis protein
MMKILIAEDEIGTAEVYQMYLVAKGHAVTLATDGKQCLESYCNSLDQLADQSVENLSQNPPFDVVVLDYRLPEIDGLEVAREILARNPEQRLIFASAYIRETLAESVQELNQVVELLQKPIELEVLLDVIENKKVHQELNKINIHLKEEETKHDYEQLKDLLHQLKKVKSKSPLTNPEILK